MLNIDNSYRFTNQKDIKKKRGRKSNKQKDEEMNEKIDNFCLKKEIITDHVNPPEDKILINLIFNNNQIEMMPKEIESEKNGMQIETEQNLNIVSTQGTQGSFCNIVVGNGIESEEENNITNIDLIIQSEIPKFIQNYTEEEIEEKYNLERYLLETEENLVMNRYPDYFSYQQFIDKRMRIILFDWVMEVCSQLSFKRATFHTTIVLIDVFLSRVPNMQTNLLQLTGVTCLIIAAKNEEIVIPSFQQFSHSTDYAYSVQQIMNYEKYILNILKWKINFPNFAFWSNYVSVKWDEFSTNFDEFYAFDLGFNNGLKLPKFRSQTKEEYLLFRNYFQLIDAISLNYESLQYSEKITSAAIIYLLLGLSLKVFEINQITKEFVHDYSIYANFHDLNTIFNRFLSNFLNCEFDDILGHIHYVSFFFALKFDYSLPLVTADDSGVTKSIYDEEVLQIQTHNPYNISSVELIINFRNSVMNAVNANQQIGMN